MTDPTPLLRPRRRRQHRRRRRLLVTAVIAASTLAVGGIATVWIATTRLAPDAAPAAVSSPLPATPELSTAADASGSASAGRIQDPVAATSPADQSGVTVQRVQIPAIDVDAAVELIDRDDTGILQPPTEWADAGWYSAGVLPGSVGPAVIAGHLDTTERAAVFARLKELTAGDTIVVTLSDGRQATFAVDSALDTSKVAFPTDEVYGPTPDAQLRLITCNGPYDDAALSYANNFVVFASLVPPG
ncbi:sortase [Leifsonia sp. YIM 134122]|uniref:Sortase n=1 Tax=Leifsonia stereocauli TaxID=3134136 RepID=A0ABU9W7E1_9MICO